MCIQPSTMHAGPWRWHASTHLGCRVLHLQQLEDRGAVVGDCDVPDVIHQHLHTGV